MQKLGKVFLLEKFMKAHKFYAGKISSGILYLIFVWTFIPAFVALIELIVALLKPADANGNIIV